MGRMARKRFIPRPKRGWRLEKMRQGPGRGGKDDPTGTLDLLAQDLRTWLRKKQAERGRRVRASRAYAPPPPVPPARRFCQELRQERPTPSDFGAAHIQKLQAQKDFGGLVAGIRKRSFDVGLALTALGRLLPARFFLRCAEWIHVFTTAEDLLCRRKA